MKFPDENYDLRRCLRDLVALSALPSVWSSSDVRAIAEGLAEILLRILSLDFIYVRAQGATTGPHIEVAYESKGRATESRTRTLAEAIGPWLKFDSFYTPPELPNPLGDGTIRLVVLPLGQGSESGFLAAGSHRADFATETERLLLRVGGNQAAIVFLRRQTEEALRQSEQDLADFFENASLGLHFFGPDGEILRVNRAELALLGYSRAEFIGHDVTEFYVDKDSLAEMLARLRAKETLKDFETRLRCKDGSIKNVLIDASVRWDDGRFVHARCFTRDITDRCIAEERLRKQSEWWKVTLASIGDAVITTDTEARVSSLNAVAQHLTGWTQADAQRMPLDRVFRIVDEQSRETVESPAARTLHEGRTVGLKNHTILIARDGREYSIDDSAAPIRDEEGNILGAVLIFRDVSEKRRAERAAHRAAQTARFLADASGTLAELCDYRSSMQKIASLSVPVFADFCVIEMFDESGAIERVAISHAEPSKIHLASELQRRYPSLVSDRYGIASVLRSGLPELVMQIDSLPDSVGTEQHAQLVAQLGLRAYLCVPLASRGRMLGAMLFAMAASERRYDQTDLQAAEDLARRAVISIENADLYRALQENDRRKDEFLATLAHELRNPLAPIRNALQIMRLPDGTPESFHTAQEMLGRQVQQMVRLIDDLLDLSRVTTGKIDLRRERVRLDAVIHNAIETSRPLISAARHELTVSLPEEPVYLDADATRLAQVVGNLLNNAAKYTRDGGQIRLSAEQRGSEATITVADTGIGIPAVMLPRIFDMFAQVDTSLERSQGGLGIGLTLVRRLVELHKGTIEAKSDGLGQGSQFIVRLPAIAGSAQTPAPRKSEGTADADGRDGRDGQGESARPTPELRVLVVDDNVDAADSLSMLLQLMGHDTRLAYSGASALEVVQSYAPEVVMLDIGLPGMNGYEVARRIREQTAAQRPVLVAITGWGQEEDRRRCKEAGFDHHLTKPADPGLVQRLLASVSRPDSRTDS